MKKTILCLLLLWFSAGFAEVLADNTAADFELKDLEGKAHKLSDFKGTHVVLEWFNKDCPFVKKHYGSNNMQSLQKKYTEKKVVWLTINSSAPGKQGHETSAEAQKTKATLGASPNFILVDAEGTVGRLYGAKTTPHMFVINPDQKVVYAGAIDDKPSYDPADIKTSKNFVQLALDASLSGKTVAISSHRPYGCAVKY